MSSISYMSPNAAGGGGLQGLISANEYSCAHGSPNKLRRSITPYLTYNAGLVFLTWFSGIVGIVYFLTILEFLLCLALGLNFITRDKNCHGGEKSLIFSYYIKAIMWVKLLIIWKQALLYLVNFSLKSTKV